MPRKTVTDCDATEVRRLREARGFTQPGLARETRRRFLAREATDYCSLSTIKRLESGLGILADKARAVAGALGVDLDQIRRPEASGREARRPPHMVGIDPNRLGLGTPSPLAIRLECERRFRKILVDDHQLVVEGRMPPERYWKSYWYHQWDQFRYWLDGALDTPSLLAWMRLRHLDYRENADTGGIDYRTAWQAARRRIEDEEFTTFMEHVFRGHLREACRPYGHLLPGKIA